MFAELYKTPVTVLR